MEKEFISYKQALALKELGFDEPCIKFYWTDGMFLKDFVNPFNYNKRDSAISAPLYQHAFRWFRKKYNLFHNVDRVFGINNVDIMYVGIYYKGNPKGNSPKNTIVSKTSYEEAELECLIKLIEIVKNKSI